MAEKRTFRWLPFRTVDEEARAACRHAYRERNRIERLINRFKRFRRIATRYEMRAEKRAANYLAVPTIAAITLWL